MGRDHSANEVSAYVSRRRVIISASRWWSEVLARLKSLGLLLVTLIAFGMVCWTLFYVLSDLGTAPTVNDKGVVTVDPYQHAKDILLVVFPLATAAVGFWFGSDGKDKAQDQAQQAQTNAASAQADAATAHTLATKAEQQKSAVLLAADDAPALLEKARSLHPEAFSG
jgi:hypothetical protein